MCNYVHILNYVMYKLSYEIKRCLKTLFCRL